jgi:hypothetical protein
MAGAEIVLELKERQLKGRDVIHTESETRLEAEKGDIYLSAIVEPADEEKDEELQRGL